MTLSRLLKSCATPPTSWPRLSSRPTPAPAVGGAPVRLRPAAVPVRLGRPAVRKCRGWPPAPPPGFGGQRAQAYLDRELTPVLAHGEDRQPLAHGPRHRVSGIVRPPDGVDAGRGGGDQDLHRLAGQLLAGDLGRRLLERRQRLRVFAGHIVAHRRLLHRVLLSERAAAMLTHRHRPDFHATLKPPPRTLAARTQTRIVSCMSLFVPEQQKRLGRVRRDLPLLTPIAPVYALADNPALGVPSHSLFVW